MLGPETSPGSGAGCLQRRPGARGHVAQMEAGSPGVWAQALRWLAGGSCPLVFLRRREAVGGQPAVPSSAPEGEDLPLPRPSDTGTVAADELKGFPESRLLCLATFINPKDVA